MSNLSKAALKSVLWPTGVKPRLFTVAAILSSLLALGTAVSWVRSYWVYDFVSCGSASGRYPCNWNSYGTSFRFSRWPPGIPQGASSAVVVSYGKILFQQAVHGEEPLSGMPLQAYSWSSDDNVIPSLSYSYAATRDMAGKGRWTVRQATVRHWALVLLFALLPAAWLFAVLRPATRPAQAPQ
jgi:hypothetical protein